MSNVARLFIFLFIFVLFKMAAYAGENANASISFDYNKAPGNQGVSSIDAPGSGTFVEFEVRVDNCGELDSYSFQLLYDTAELIYTSYDMQNLPLEKNILNQKGNYLFESPVVTNDDSAPVGVLTVSVVNTTTDPTKCGSGEGLLGKVEFYTNVDAPKSIQFGEVKWKDSEFENPLEDICPEENKGEFFMGGGSLPVELSAFTASFNGETVLLQWITESEKDSWGFNILRSEARDGYYERVNASLIKGAGTTTMRTSYHYTDSRVDLGSTYYYKLEQVDVNGSKNYYGPIEISLSPAAGETPDHFVLYDNYPNPFNPETTIKFAIPQDELVTLEIYNIAGVKIRTLVNSSYKAGEYSATWDGRKDNGDKVSSGAYLYKFRAGAFVKNGKMMLLN